MSKYVRRIKGLTNGRKRVDQFMANFTKSRSTDILFYFNIVYWKKSYLSI